MIGSSRLPALAQLSARALGAAGAAGRALVRRRRRTPVVLAVALAALAATAALGWARTPTQREARAASIRITDVRPLRSPDPSLRDLITHTVAVRVAIDGWALLPYQPGATQADNRPAAGHWRLYHDGRPLGDNLGDEHVTYTYLPPGEHWLAAELSNADSTSLNPAVWSEPVIVHVPRVVRCWQKGWRGSPETGTPTFSCDQHRRTRALRGTTELPRGAVVSAAASSSRHRPITRISFGKDG